MSTAHLIKQIRQLPYADMILLAQEMSSELQAKLGVSAEAFVLADIMSRLKAGAEKLTETEAREMQTLKKIFKRKRALNVALMSHGAGFSVNISELPASVAHGPDLRKAINDSLDQVITYHLLTEGK